ncbi:MAG: glycosyltransferase family 39 protein [Sedimentisphaerales bacterium]|nr:glycosyltransferase family 39 protein [Sedimentisphaerales bacterium]
MGEVKIDEVKDKYVSDHNHKDTHLCSDPPLLDSDDLRLRRRCNIGMAILLTAMFLLICLMSTSDIFGTPYAFDDMVAYISGTNFAKHGFVKLRFLPVHFVGPMGDAPRYYLHYPPLPNIISGVAQSLGITGLMPMRIICGLFLIAGMACIYKALSHVAGHFVTLCGMTFLFMTQYFVRLALSIHHHSYDLLFFGIFLLIFLRTIEKEQPAKKQWLLCWLALMLSSLSSYEYIIYTQLFGWTFLLVSGNLRRRWYVLIFLATAPVVGVALHFLQNCWAIGFSAALEDNLGFGFWQGGLSAGRLRYMWVMPQNIVRRSLYYYNISCISLVIFAVLVPVLKKQKDVVSQRRFYAALLGAIVAPMGWLVLMPGHSIKHPHIVNQFLPLLVIALGCVVACMLKLLMKKDHSRWHKVLIIAVLLFLIASQVQNFVKNHLRGYYRSPENTLLQAIGPEGLPADAALLCSLPPQFAVNTEFLLQRQCWTLKGTDITKSRQPDPDNPRFSQSFLWDECLIDYLTYTINNDYTLKQLYQYLTGIISDDCPLRYFLYLGKDGYTNNPLFKMLAANCPGRIKKIEPEDFGSPRYIILFDISGLQLPMQERPVLADNTKQQQLEGVFPPLKINGFEERLNTQVRKYHLFHVYRGGEGMLNYNEYAVKRP